MKTKALSSFFVLFAIAAGIVAMTPAAFADHSEVTIEAAMNSGVPGCEETAEGCYIPGTATVDVGGVVIFSNPDTAAHTFTSGDPSIGHSGLFDSSLVMAGSTYEWSPTEAGEVPYFCMVHPWMLGTIIVQKAPIEKPSSISVSFDKSSYNDGDVIKFSGKITNPKDNTPVNLTMKYSNNIINIAQVSHNTSGIFFHSFESGGPLMKNSGQYYVTVNYGNVSIEKAFNYDADISCERGTELINGICQEIVKDPSSISVWSDKATYNEGDAIKISGRATNYESGTKVILVIHSASENHTSTTPITPNADGTFSLFFPSDSKLMKNDSIYTFTAQYGDVSAKDVFYYYANPDEEPTPPDEEPTSPDGGPKIDDPKPGFEVYAVIVGIVVSVIVGFAVYLKTKKSKGVKSLSSTENSEYRCNVCETHIPKGENVCPNCGDTYSV